MRADDNLMPMMMVLRGVVLAPPPAILFSRSHMWPYERPNAFNRALLEWLEEQ